MNLDIDIGTLDSSGTDSLDRLDSLANDCRTSLPILKAGLDISILLCISLHLVELRQSSFRLRFILAIVLSRPLHGFPPRVRSLFSEGVRHDPHKDETECTVLESRETKSAVSDTASSAIEEGTHAEEEVESRPPVGRAGQRSS